MTPYKTAAEIRRDNLALVLDRHFDGKAARLAEALGVKIQQISCLTSDSRSRRNIGDALARDIEAAAGLERGWMDTVHNDMDGAFDKLKRLSAKERARVLALLDSYFE